MLRAVLIGVLSALLSCPNRGSRYTLDLSYLQVSFLDLGLMLAISTRLAALSQPRTALHTPRATPFSNSMLSMVIGW